MFCQKIGHSALHHDAIANRESVGFKTLVNQLDP